MEMADAQREMLKRARDQCVPETKKYVECTKVLRFSSLSSSATHSFTIEHLSAQLVLQGRVQSIRGMPRKIVRAMIYLSLLRRNSYLVVAAMRATARSATT